MRSKRLTGESVSSDIELSGSPWDDLYFTPEHPDADVWRDEIAAEMAAGYPEPPARRSGNVLPLQMDLEETR
ncbi:hypothetical protein MED01_002487 [Micromonospora sp. MED01]|uniref:hypothetical protein n=1 Tax=Micromonospora alfalfae TaxID=2911212 RepID=UPI001EE9882C|nr:hypothetical protein [Micromonospora alfalfae]MCG5464321.1 hypothetical protein [Micromonospora alfalfae]